MDLIVFLKIVPAVLGVAGLLTYSMRPREPDPQDDLETLTQAIRKNSVLIGCGALILFSTWLFFRPAPPDHDAALPPERAFVQSLS
ncbi:hypothetical protein [Methylocapsa palsarum]|uniref:Uncharacterized protein n=1 Tax=Methylocapsa palsarum TaxID=1612308 RepID=A0A1I4A922_9HYPH|nr:hypothetical protein [Methylocapsa palsarum]SFK52803.1 hypothetical protein SAMN05444581_109150 [Methylocapsa palsarum]